MSETIWRATDIDGACFQFLRHKPEWNGKEFGLGYGDGASAYTGNDKPPPGECWEMTVTRKGEQPSGGQVLSEHKATIAELQAKLERPEMPEAVRSLIGDLLREVPGRFNQAIAAVEAHYAPPFRIQGPGVYSAKLGKDKELVIRLIHHRQDGWLGYFDGTGAVWLFDDSGRAGGVQLTKYLRPLEG